MTQLYPCLLCHAAALLLVGVVPFKAKHAYVYNIRTRTTMLASSPTSSPFKSVMTETRTSKTSTKHFTNRTSLLRYQPTLSFSFFSEAVRGIYLEVIDPHTECNGGHYDGDIPFHPCLLNATPLSLLNTHMKRQEPGQAKRARECRRRLKKKVWAIVLMSVRVYFFKINANSVKLV